MVILDVRTPAEFNSVKISSASSVDFYEEDFAESLDKLDKDQTYLVYCAAGKRSNQAMMLMQSKGFKTVYDLDGGIRAWQKAGYPVE